MLTPQGYILLSSSQLFALLLGAVLFFALGFLDDLFNIPAHIRLLCQLAFAFLVAIYGVRIDWLFGIIALPKPLSVILTCLWIVGMVNAINFIDGLDGLAGGISAIALFAVVVISMVRGEYFFALLALVLVGVLLGFLPFNFFPAKIFLGDGGAMFLGYILSAISILGFFKQTALIVFLIPILLFLFPIVDTTFAILRRIVRGQAPLVADKKHIHHRLLLVFSRAERRKALRNGITINDSLNAILEGLAHRNTVLILYLITALLAVIAIYSGVRTFR